MPVLDQILGFGFALAAMLLYGVYMVPRKQTPVSQGAYTLWMGCGILLGTALIGLITNGGPLRCTPVQYVMMVGSGILWGTGTLAYCVGVKSIGLARSSPIKNTSAILGTLIGIVVFHEFTFSRALPLVLVVLGSLSVMVSATVLSRVTSLDDEADEGVWSRSFIYGVLASAWAAVAYSIYTIPMKFVYEDGVTPSEFLFFMGQGCFIGMMAMGLALMRRHGAERVSWKHRGAAALSGVMWAVGSLCANMAIKIIGVAVAWPITKNTVVAVVYGVVVLNEVDTIRHRRDLRLGLLLAVSGVVFLALAMR